ncbi:hypothetical protein HYW40_03430 [Candidatus Curtissbacteria bacterium]|nr:hypothetical protein [Candidatus Curtissbacteria bacterium]
MKKQDKIFVLATFGIFGFLFFHLARNMLQISPDGWYVGQINLYGDLVFHLSLISKFLSSNGLLIDNPIFAGTKVNYPIFADLITAQIAAVTNLTFALFVTTSLAGLLVIYIARIFIKSFIKSEKIVFLSLLLFFINGGFGFYYFFQDLFFSQKPFVQFILSMPHSYTDLKDKGYWWINTYLAYFLPQRTFLFAFPITLVVLMLLYSGFHKNQRKYFLLAGLLSGVLPLVQAHSLFLIFLILLIFAPLAVLKSSDRHKILNNLFIFALVTLVLSVPILITISQAQNFFSFIRYDPGWTSTENIIWFWFKNLGLFGPLLIISLIWLYRKNRHLFLLYLPFLFIFIISNIFVFQPWDFDNSKLLVYWFFVSCIVVAYFLYDQFFQETIPKKIWGLVLVFLMTFSGSLDLLRTFTPVTKYQIFSQEDIEVAQKVKNLTAQNSVFVTASNHNHPIAALSGRSIFLGFHGWLWSHGVDFAAREKEVKEIYLGEEEAERLIKQYRINYVTIGPPEKTEFSINVSYFQKYPVIYLTEGWQIYDVSHIWTDGDRQN